MALPAIDSLGRNFSKNLENSKRKCGFHALPDHEKFQRSVGATLELKGVIAGLFFRLPKTAVLFYSRIKMARTLTRASTNAL